jgi:hypothetical protein
MAQGRWRAAHTHGRLRALSWQVATLVARVISSGVANDSPASAVAQSDKTSVHV